MLDWDERPADPLPGRLPGVIPDNRVLLRQRRHTEPTPISDLVKDAIFIRGTISGLDAQGVAWLRSQVVHPALKRCDLVFSLYGGCRTWDDVLLDALDLQDANTDRVAFRVLGRRIGPDRPANLLWLQAEMSESGVIVVGNVSNFMVGARWDPTDAVVVTAIDAAGADALRRWFDSVHAHSRALTSTTARAPRLRLPEGTAEGERMWREYLKTLHDAVSRGLDLDAEVKADPETGEIVAAPERTPTQTGALPKPDPVLLSVQTVLSRGTLVSIERVGRAPPLNMPIRPDFFGELAEERVGSAARRQSFSVSLFDEKTRKALDNLSGALADRLRGFSLMLRESQRWMPHDAFPLFEREIEDAQEKSRKALADVTGGKTPEDFVAGLTGKIEKDLIELAARIGARSKPTADLMERVTTGLKQRLAANLGRGMVPNVSRTAVNLPAHQDECQTPWGAVQTFLASAARLPREVIANPFRMRGLSAKPEPFLEAFDVFEDPLPRGFLNRRRVDDDAKRDLDVIDRIEADEVATPRQRAHALYRLIKGERPDAALAALQDGALVA